MPEQTVIDRSMTEILHDDEAGIAAAARLLRDGALVAFGTETVYGLGADATNAAAVAGIFAAKGRPRFNPLICHYESADTAFRDVVADDRARVLAAALWPGPLTLVLPRHSKCPIALLTGAGLDTQAVRVPAHATARSLLHAVGRPVAAPSANLSGQVSPTTAAHVLAGLRGRIAAVLDSGPCLVGVESTVLDLSGRDAVLLRPGGATVEAIEALIGPLLPFTPPGSAFRSPGMLASHYAPSLPVRLNARGVSLDEALLAFGPPLAGAGAMFQLSESGNPTEAAARLFEGLRALDILGMRGIAAMPIPPVGLGLAIVDRLKRAAAPRP
jgi:L-threonylcarbamoyladenylate synthase